MIPPKPGGYAHGGAIWPAEADVVGLFRPEDLAGAAARWRRGRGGWLWSRGPDSGRCGKVGLNHGKEVGRPAQSRFKHTPSNNGWISSGAIIATSGRRALAAPAATA
ncbi:hypothetical protein MishRS11D_33470 [Methylomagnum ishizawai]|nr:hypothetical protein MishRS11D_33470 [Methylomagnum ishizawai]